MNEAQLSELEKSLELSAEFHGLKNLGKRFDFYYDETNNIRKLHIRENNKLNVADLGDFVLGGVVCEPRVKPFDLSSLRSILNLDAGIKEVKLKHIARGEFLELLSSEKLNKFLQWVVDQNLMVHHFHLDPLYWSVVDIVDSVLLHIPELQSIHFHLKSDLHEVIKRDLDSAVSVLAKYDYPDVKPENVRRFSEELLELLGRNSKALPEFNYKMLKGLLQQARDLKSLDFVEGYNSKKLIERFDVFFITRMLMFKNSLHIFDNEPVIVEGFTSSQLITDKFKNNYKFVLSEDSAGTQISDVFVGLMGKLYTYIRNACLDEVSGVRKNLEESSKRNLDLLDQLSTKSENESMAFIQHVASGHDLHKLKLLFGYTS